MKTIKYKIKEIKKALVQKKYNKDVSNELEKEISKFYSLGNLKQNYRHLHVIDSLLRHKTIRQIESKNHQGNKIKIVYLESYFNILLKLLNKENELYVNDFMEKLRNVKQELDNE